MVLRDKCPFFLFINLFFEDKRGPGAKSFGHTGIEG